LHPSLPGLVYFWTPNSGIKKLSFTFTQMRERSDWVGSPAEISQRTGRAVTYTIGKNSEFDNHDGL
jgi:hypothetical protein